MFFSEEQGMKIKICGIRRREDVEYLNEAVPDFAGFVFADTRRQVSRERAAELKRLLRPDIKVFGVFVNAPIEQAAELVKRRTIDAVQLHGGESEEYICELRAQVNVPVIKAVRAKNCEAILAADELSCDYLLIDTYSEMQYGGTGRSFDWKVIPEGLKHPYFLAGGLNAANIQQAMETVHCRGKCIGVDVSGGVETEGDKDKEKIYQMVKLVHEKEAQVL